MTQPSLLDLPPREPRTHRRVRETSLGVYAEARERLKGRKADVLRWLGHYYNSVNRWPTSAELARWVNLHDHGEEFIGSFNDLVLYTRRGLADLSAESKQPPVALRVVESCGSRRCTVSGRTCLVWRVRSR